MDSIYINKNSAIERLGGSAKLYINLLKRFLSNNNYIQELKNHIEANDLNAAEFTVHTIKGLSANLSLDALLSISAEVDTQLKNEIIDNDSIQKLELVMEATINAINDYIAF